MAGLQSESSPAAADPRRLIGGALKLAADDATIEVIHPAPDEVGGQVFGGMGTASVLRLRRISLCHRHHVSGRRGLLPQAATTT